MNRRRREVFDRVAAFTTTRREIERHARHVGAADTDDLPRWLIAWVWFNPQAQDPIGAVIECARSIGRALFTLADAQAVLDEAASTPKQKHMKADDLAKWLGVTYVERQKLRLTRIGAKDVGKRSRKVLRKLRDLRAKERKRRSCGAIPRAEYEANSLSRTQPWVIEGISRRTWERRRNIMRTAVVASPSTAVFLRPVDTPASAECPQERSRQGKEGEAGAPISSQGCLTTSALHWVPGISITFAADKPKSEREKKRALFRAHCGVHEQPGPFKCEEATGQNQSALAWPTFGGTSDPAAAA